MSSIQALIQEAREGRPSPEFLRLILSCEPDSGLLYWRARTREFFTDGKRTADQVSYRFNCTWSGKPAFTARMTAGYRSGRIYNHTYTTHRVIWAIANGAWPEGLIDHINRVRDDNRIANLRVVDNSGNCRNQSISVTNKTGATGVFRQQSGRFTAFIGADGRRHDLGSFGTFEEALAARKVAEARFGFIGANPDPDWMEETPVRAGLCEWVRAA